MKQLENVSICFGRKTMDNVCELKNTSTVLKYVSAGFKTYMSKTAPLNVFVMH